MSESKGEKVYGGLIKKEPRVTKSKEGHVTTEHFSGQKDVKIRATPLNTRIVVQNPGSE